MTLWLLVPMLALISIIQVAWLPLIPIFGFKIDLALAVVVSWGLIGPVGQAAQWGFIVGIFLDLASGLPFGIHMLTLTVIGLLIGLGQTTFFRGNLVAPPLLMIAAVFLDHILILAILSLFNWQIEWSDYLLRVTMPTSILNMLITPFVYLPLQFLQRRLYPQMDF